MIKSQLHNQHFQFTNIQNRIPAIHLKNLSPVVKGRENLYQTYIKSRLSKKKVLRIQNSTDDTPRTTKLGLTDFVIQNKKCSLKNRVKKYITEVDRLSLDYTFQQTQKIMRRKNPFVKQKEDWRELDPWRVLDDTIY